MFANHYLGVEKRREKLAIRFSQFVVDGDLEWAKKFLTAFESNQSLLIRLLTTEYNLIQKCGFEIAGPPLENAFKCGDWFCGQGAPQEEMAELLIRFLLKLPDGKARITSSIQKLFPNGIQAHLDSQVQRAIEFSNQYLEPLADSIKTASDEDINLVNDLAVKKSINRDPHLNEVNNHIRNQLVGNAFWHKLLEHRAAIRNYMKEETIYNQSLIVIAFWLCVRKYEKEKWPLTDTQHQLKILSRFAIGSVQVCSPMLIQMIFAAGNIKYYFNQPKGVSKFKLGRNPCFHRHSPIERLMFDASVFAQTDQGLVLTGIQYYLSIDGCRGEFPKFERCQFGYRENDYNKVLKFFSTQSTALKALCSDYLPESTPNPA